MTPTPVAASLGSQGPFSVSNDTVFWQTVYGPAPLSEQNIEGLLDCWMAIGGPVSRKLYLDLHDAASETSWFLKRPVIWKCSSQGSSEAEVFAPLPCRPDGPLSAEKSAA